MLDTFHFLRTEWLIAFPFIILLLFLLKRRQQQQKSGWENVCDPQLLHYQLMHNKTLLNNPTKPSSILFNKAMPWLLPMIGFIAIIALAGPTWEKKPQPAFQQGNALVILLDLSLSMNANDLKPSRLERAKLKLIDILKQKKEGQTALIAFAGDAHTVSPLTIDNKTIISLLPALDSSIMPLNGSHLLDALNTAEQLFQNSGFAQGDILLLSDGIDSSQQQLLEQRIKQLYQHSYHFSVIGLGSRIGSPIPLPEQGFVKDSSGHVIISKLQSKPLKKLTSLGGGSYAKLSLDNSDFNRVLNQKTNRHSLSNEQESQLEQWVDLGAYLTLLLIPFALLGFRKGLLNISLISCLISSSFFINEPVSAETQWQQLWATPDQQGEQSFSSQDYSSAAEKFSDNDWKASAYYRAGDYEKALQYYQQSTTANSLYNQGNSLANMNKIEEAIKSYQQALKKETELAPKMKKNIQQNLDYLNKILEQQKQQQSDGDDSKKSGDSEQSSDSQNEKQQNSETDNQEKEADGNNKENKNSEQSQYKKNSAEEQNKQESSDTQQQQAVQETNKDESSSSEAKSPEQAIPTPQVKPDPKNLQENKNQPDQSQNIEAKQQDDSEKTEQPTTDDILSQLSQEEQQSLKQWLQRIPDNPGKLLRIKFRNNSLLKQRQIQPTDTQYKGDPW
jgi:Ca-activated chloride channel family protein